MLKFIGFALVVAIVAVVAVLAWAATRPDMVRIARSSPVHEPPDNIFAVVNAAGPATFEAVAAKS